MRISITDGTGEVLWCIVAFIAAAETVSPFSMNGIAMRQAKKLITAAEIRVSIIGFSGICPEVTVLACNITHSPVGASSPHMAVLLRRSRQGHSGKEFSMWKFPSRGALISTCLQTLLRRFR